MRDFLYLWHDVDARCIVMSGMEFRDLLPALSRSGGVLLLDHQAESGQLDVKSMFEHVAAGKLASLADENIYSWGNFVWADYAGSSVPMLTDEDVAALLFFGHRGRPLDGIVSSRLGNRFLGYGHDDGWYLRLYYVHWSDVVEVLATIPPTVGTLDVDALRQGDSGFWLSAGRCDQEEKTHTVDHVLNRRLRA